MSVRFSLVVTFFLSLVFLITFRLPFKLTFLHRSCTSVIPHTFLLLYFTTFLFLSSALHFPSSPIVSPLTCSPSPFSLSLLSASSLFFTCLPHAYFLPFRSFLLLSLLFPPLLSLSHSLSHSTPRPIPSIHLHTLTPTLPHHTHSMPSSPIGPKEQPRRPALLLQLIMMSLNRAGDVCIRRGEARLGGECSFHPALLSLTCSTRPSSRGEK